jgi:hypothetical protein
MKRLTLLLGALLALCAPMVRAQTINAASCSAADVQTAFNSVVTSTTQVNIPAGSCNWTTQVTLNVPSGNTNLSIIGATTISGSCAPGGTCTATDSTTITDNDGADQNCLICLGPGVASSFFRLSGLTVNIGSGHVKYNGMVAVSGYSQSTRLDHLHLNAGPNTPMRIGSGGWMYGVMDHSIIEDSGAVDVWDDNWGNPGGTTNTNYFGDDSFATATNFGSGNAFFFENNVFNSGSIPGQSASYMNDCYSGGRLVIRYNTMNNVGMDEHPTGGAGADIRGCRSMEVYGNQFNGAISPTTETYDFFYMQSATALVWNNTASGYEHFLDLHTTRSTDTTYAQSPTPGGWGYCGSTSGLSGDESAWDQTPTSTYGYKCLDEPGTGQSDLLNGTAPSKVDTATGTLTWPNQALEPLYEWLNSYTPSSGFPSSTYYTGYAPGLAANTDYYAYTGSFTGSSGTGSGLLASRPASCTTGVAYWATDQSTLYKCVGTNSWASYYTPYVYPHPLDTGGGSITLASIAVTGANTTAVGGTVDLTATCTYTGSGAPSPTNCTGPSTDSQGNAATWTSGTTLHATVGSTTGIVTGVAAGTSNITATAAGVNSPGFTVTVSSTTTYYMSPSGSDSNSGTSSGSPWATPNHSIACGTTISAAAGAYGTALGFGNWGTVTGCGSGSSENIAAVVCATPFACTVSLTSGSPGVGITASNWGVFGFVATATGGTASCFEAYPLGGSTIHHIVFGNDIANGCNSAGFSSPPNGSAGVDYFNVVGSISYNGSQESSECGSGISIWEPVQSDTLAGTHIYISQTFDWHNVNPNPCAGTPPTDGEGIIFDTWDANSYAQQGVMENNISLYNGNTGLRVDSTTLAHTFILNNTAYANAQDSAMVSSEFGEIFLQEDNNATASKNIVQPTVNTVGGYPVYTYGLSFYSAGSPGTNTVSNNQGYSSFGNDTNCQGTCTGFTFGPGNTTTNPSFTSAPGSVPSAPSCSSYATVPACMAALITDLTPTNGNASWGYQPVSGSVVSDPYFPAWLCNVTQLSGLVTRGCAAGPTLSSIAVTTTGGITTFGIGVTNQLTATCTYTGSGAPSPTNCTTTDSQGNRASFTSGTPATGTVTSPGGLFTAVAAGTTNVTANVGAVTSSPVTLTVSPSVLAATPSFSPTSATFSGSLSVTISDTTPSSTIYYTNDGSTPTTGSTVYSSPLTLTATTTLKAIATASGFVQSNIGTSVYTLSSGGDTRTVTEPVFPPVCQVLNAVLSIGTSTSINNDPYNVTPYLPANNFSYEPSSETAFDTTRVQNALNSCASGQAVELAPSTDGTKYGFLLQRITVPTGVSLTIDPGVGVYASRNPADYGGTNCGVVTSAGGGCNHWITGPNTTGSGIYGYGRLDGRGWDRLLVGGVQQSYSWYSNTIQAYCNKHSGAINGSPPCTPNSQGGNQYGPNILAMVNASSFTLYKTTLHAGPEFQFEWEGTNGGTQANGLTVWGAKIITPFETSNTDGIDPTNNFQNVTVEDSFISNGDNQMAMKSTNGGGAGKNVSILNNHTYAGIEIGIGSDTGGGFSNVVVSGLTQNGNLNNVQSAGIGINSSTSNGGTVSNITFTDICQVNEHDTWRFYTNYGCDTGSQTPLYTGIKLSNITVLPSTAPYTTGNSGYFTFQGLNSSNLMGLSLNNININGTNQGVTQQCSVTKDQYAQIALGPNFVDSSLLSQFAAGTSVNTTGSGSGGTPYNCSYPSSFQPIVGELLMMTPTATNQQCRPNCTFSGSTATYTLQVVIQPATEINSKESYALTSGPITFSDNGTPVGTATIGTYGDNGTLAQLTLTNVAAGTHHYTATYPSDGHYASWTPYTFGSLNVDINGCTPGCTAPPTFSPTTEGFTGTVTVTISDSSPSPTIYYTTDGSVPTTGSSVYSTPLTFSATTTLRAIATSSGLTTSTSSQAVYTLGSNPAATPTFSPNSETFTGSISVVISDSTSSPTVYYTLDGSTPTTASTVYSGPLAISASTTVKAIATASGFTQSAVGTAVYSLSGPTAATPLFTPGSQAFTGTLSVVISDTTPSSTIYYTTNGTTPNTGSTVYSGPISVSANTIINAIAVATGYITSAMGTATYTLSSQTPTIIPGPQKFSTTLTVSIVSPAGGVIHYTVDGSTPTSASPLYAGAFTISASTTVKAITIVSGVTSLPATVIYTQGQCFGCWWK